MPKQLAAVLVFILMAACSFDQAIRRSTPPGADARAREYLALFTRHQVDSAEARVVPSLAGPEAHQAFRQIDSVLAGQRMDSTRVVGVQTNTINGIRHTNMSYELRTSRGWVVANVATVDSAGTWFVEGISAQGIPQSLEKINGFALRGRCLLHYVWLLLTLACAGFTLAVGTFVATRHGMPRRWLWAFVALLGIGAFRLDWASGATNIQLVNVQLFAAAALRSGPAAPWILTFAIPLGAFVALARYRKWRHALSAT